MKAQLENLKRQYRTAKTQAERDEILHQSALLANQDAEAFGENMVSLARDTADEAARLAVRTQLEELAPIISISFIARTYFNKSRQWFYQKLNGNIVNGKPARFTEEEINTLNEALQDISEKIGSVKISR